MSFCEHDNEPWGCVKAALQYEELRPPEVDVGVGTVDYLK